MMEILKSQMRDALLKSIKGVAYILVATTYTSYIVYIWRWGDLIISVFKPYQEPEPEPDFIISHYLQTYFTITHYLQKIH